MLEVIETPIAQYEPAPFPSLPTSALFKQPTLLLGAEEGLDQVVVGLVGDFERFFLNAFVNEFLKCERESIEASCLTTHSKV